jgi:cytochrome c-type biogenesis protein CcmE
MKKSHIIAILLIAIAIGAIMSTVSDSSTYANFTEAKKNPDDEYHVVGKLNKEKAFEYAPEKNANLFAFYLKDNQGVERKVLYNGAKPQDFERSEQVVIVGKYGNNDEFNATQILMKCPSKYNNGQEVAANSN